MFRDKAHARQRRPLRREVDVDTSPTIGGLVADLIRLEAERTPGATTPANARVAQGGGE